MSEQSNPAADAAAARDQVAVRRAPRIGAFLVVGGLLGFFVTLLLTSLFDPDPNVGFAALVGYFSLYGITAGVTLGALVALIIDRRSRRRTRMVVAEREVVDAHDADPAPSADVSLTADPARETGAAQD